MNSPVRERPSWFKSAPLKTRISLARGSNAFTAGTTIVQALWDSPIPQLHHQAAPFPIPPTRIRVAGMITIAPMNEKNCVGPSRE